MINTNILNDISVYDPISHLPYPTLGFIHLETGENIVENQGGNEIKAKAFVKQITNTAWRILSQSKTKETANRLEYLIATNPDYRKSFLDYVCSFIYDMFLNGVDNFLNPTDELNLVDTMTAKTKSFIEGSLLGVSRFAWFPYEYRVGY